MRGLNLLLIVHSIYDYVCKYGVPLPADPVPMTIQSAVRCQPSQESHPNVATKKTAWSPVSPAVVASRAKVPGGGSEPAPPISVFHLWSPGGPTSNSLFQHHSSGPTHFHFVRGRTTSTPFQLHVFLIWTHFPVENAHTTDENAHRPAWI